MAILIIFMIIDLSDDPAYLLSADHSFVAIGIVLYLTIICSSISIEDCICDENFNEL
jgi:hypothetical protein